MTIQLTLLGTGFGQPQSFIFISNTTGTSWPAPAGSTSVIVEAIGGGGRGFGGSTTVRASGGGGQYARSGRIGLSGGTVVYFSVGGPATQSWVNVGANSAPSSSANGVLAPAGSNATSGVAGLGNLGTAVGTYTVLGGDGAVGLNAYGGGAAGAGSYIFEYSNDYGSNPLGGSDYTSIISYDVSFTQTYGSEYKMGFGNGGSSSSTSTVGIDPGGGGGAGTTSGTNRAGGSGRVRITFY